MVYGFGIKWEICSSSSSSGSVFCIMAHPEANTAHTKGRETITL